MPQLYCGKKNNVFFLCLIQIARDNGLIQIAWDNGLIQIARDNCLSEFCVEEVEFLRTDIPLEAVEEERDFICTQLQPCKPDWWNGWSENVV